VSAPNEIINVLLKGETHNSGDNIEYELLIHRMIEMKEKLKAEIESSRRREVTIEGMTPRTTSIIKKIYDELAKSGDDGEKLASAFRKVASRQSVVSALHRARRRGKLID